MKQNTGKWRYLIFGPDDEMRMILKGFDEDPPTRRRYLRAIWWNWRKRTWRKIIGATVCKARGHDMSEIEPNEAMWHGGQSCRRCSKIDYYNEDGTIWKPA